MSPDVPGSKELKAFYQKNSDSFPWAAMSGGANGGMQKAMADMQKKMSNFGGVPLVQIIRMKTGGGASAQMAQAQAGMEQARAKLESHGQAGWARRRRRQTGARPHGAPWELAGVERSWRLRRSLAAFRPKPIADSEFAIPAGYTKQDSPLADGRAHQCRRPGPDSRQRRQRPVDFRVARGQIPDDACVIHYPGEVSGDQEPAQPPS